MYTLQIVRFTHACFLSVLALADRLGATLPRLHRTANEKMCSTCDLSGAANASNRKSRKCRHKKQRSTCDLGGAANASNRRSRKCRHKNSAAHVLRCFFRLLSCAVAAALRSDCVMHAIHACHTCHHAFFSQRAANAGAKTAQHMQSQEPQMQAQKTALHMLSL